MQFPLNEIRRLTSSQCTQIAPLQVQCIVIWQLTGALWVCPTQ